MSAASIFFLFSASATRAISATRCPDLDGLFVPAGTAVVRSFVIRRMDGRTAVNDFVTGDAITATVWPGDSYAETFSPTVEWETAATGAAIITIDETESAIAPGDYRIQVLVDADGLSRVVHDGILTIGTAPGAVAAPSVYCDYDLMRSLFTGLEAIRTQQADTTGFLEFRGRARQAVNYFLQERYDPRPDWNRRRGVTPDPIYGFDVPERTTVPPTKATIRTLLDGDGLILAGSDGEILRIAAAKLAIAEVLGREGTSNYRPGVSYADIAKEFKAEAMEKLATYRAYVDTDDDGSANILIDRDVVFLV